ncbi:Pectin lyase-like superfamily protein [Prunus dulcis]|uniref:Pectin lyase-like superfamily protein n=1 Tax=Prunus dulcis TaxID=3755 RepID=A0A4Y1RW00_PRUDU|nr:Pectin lyase-like superfamily protein [Prunus dulcis]
MKYHKVCGFLLVISGIACSTEHANQTTFDVRDYGAVSGGRIDDSEAFLKAWNAACTSETENPTLIVPRKRFLLNPIVFSGPCRAENINFLIFGRLLAPDSPGAWKELDPSQWLAFNGVSGLNIAGPGRINGRGKAWWDQSCRDHPRLGTRTIKPYLYDGEAQAVKLVSCKNSSISEIHFLNSSQTHVLIRDSDGINIENVLIEAPERSPNTDGIHISASHNVVITNAIIGTGDDCVSIGDHTSNIVISYVKCGPGHGISIGSLGRSGNFVQVENIHVSKVYLQGTTNGARIKTWQVGRGYVRQVTFEHIFFGSVKNPIIIDQNYCNKSGACKEMETGVHITDVSFNQLYGTSSSRVAMNLNCSRSVACTSIYLKSIYIRSALAGQNVTSNCTNAHGVASGVIQPDPCLQI